MANIQSVITGRHIWKETILMRGNQKVPGSLLCTNCRKPWYGDEGGDPPLKGCISDIDVSKVSDDRLRDYREQEMRIRGENDRQERAFLRAQGLMDEEGNVIQG